MVERTSYHCVISSSIHMCIMVQKKSVLLSKKVFYCSEHSVVGRIKDL